MARRRKRAHPYLWTAVAAVLAVVWVGSYWIGVDLRHTDNGWGGYQIATVSGGTAGVGVFSSGPYRGLAREWFVRRGWTPKEARHWRWLPWYETGPGRTFDYTCVEVPLWTLVVTASALAGIHWRRATLGFPGICPTCGYNRAGLAADAVCPECGAASAAPAPREGIA